MTFKFVKSGLTMVAVLFAATAAAQHGVPEVGYDEEHVQRWNAFVGKLYILHVEQLAGREVKTNRSVGGYYRYPEFYDEVEYVDAATGRLLSKILWQRNLGGAPASGQTFTPEQAGGRIHSIEVLVHDANGRVSRDYSASYLPDFRNAPIQTLVSLHNYNGALHAFRVFDANGNRIFEVCREDGKELISLNEDEMYQARRKPDSIIYGEKYKACFGDMERTADAYLSPH